MGIEIAARSAQRNGKLKRHALTFFLCAATAFGIYLCLQIAAPFLSAVVWAVTLAVLSAPLQRWLERRLMPSGVAALTTVMLIGIIVFVCATFLGERLISQAASGAQVIEAQVKSGEWRRVLQAKPGWVAFAEKIDNRIDLPGLVSTFATWLSGMAGSIVKGSVVQISGFLLTFYLLFFFLRDRQIALETLNSLSPLSRGEMKRLTGRVFDTVHATIYGTITVATLQGILGGLMLWWLGFAAAMLWGVVMALLALIPMLGAFVIWGPAALYLLLEGSWGKALILVLWGMLIVGTVDNLLRPILVGGRLRMHTILAFMSVVGGLILFGSAGLVLGPVLLTITVVLLEVCRERMNGETTDLDERDQEPRHLSPRAKACEN